MGTLLSHLRKKPPQEIDRSCSFATSCDYNTDTQAPGATCNLNSCSAGSHLSALDNERKHDTGQRRAAMQRMRQQPPLQVTQIYLKQQHPHLNRTPGMPLPLHSPTLLATEIHIHPLRHRLAAHQTHGNPLPIEALLPTPPRHHAQATTAREHLPRAEHRACSLPRLPVSPPRRSVSARRRGEPPINIPPQHALCHYTFRNTPTATRISPWPPPAR